MENRDDQTGDAHKTIEERLDTFFETFTKTQETPKDITLDKRGNVS
jgi:hypothetical protein